MPASTYPYSCCDGCGGLTSSHLCCTAPHVAALVCVQVDPTLTRADRLVGQVLGEVGALPDVFIELEINFFLLRRLLGVRTAVGALVQQVDFLLEACLQTAAGVCGWRLSRWLWALAFCGGHCGVQAGLTMHNPADCQFFESIPVSTHCCVQLVLVPTVVHQQLSVMPQPQQRWR